MTSTTRLSAITAAMILTSATVSTGQDAIGKAEFLSNCAVCHGHDGAGNGPILDYLKEAPADLTKIADRAGGRFPFQDVYDTIADVDSNRAHGTSEMPVWGNRFNMAVIAVEGEFGSASGSVPSARTRILELVFYLASIQQ